MKALIKIFVGIGGLTLLYLAFDLWNLFLAFLTIVMVPLSALYMVGLISEGTYEAIASGKWLQDLQERVRKYRNQIKLEDRSTEEA